ncbi:MAG: BrnT family toxin [Planctomycetaceae bacterium]|nr:BrnT family toxin [Planctomycetaceae bacterium]
MPVYLFIWNDQIEQHVAEHGVTPDEFEEVVCDPDEIDKSHSSGREIAFGETATGKYLACVYEFLDETTVLPVTAYEVEG